MRIRNDVHNNQSEKDNTYKNTIIRVNKNIEDVVMGLIIIEDAYASKIEDMKEQLEKIIDLRLFLITLIRNPGA